VQIDFGTVHLDEKSHEELTLTLQYNILTRFFYVVVYLKLDGEWPLKEISCSSPSGDVPKISDSPSLIGCAGTTSV
jgi:hypothetical protein